MRRHDVAVIGAGLAGLHCARLLAERGLSVVLIDRKTSVTGPIHTTGIFVRKTWEDFALPAEQLGSGIRDVLLYSPRGKSLHLTAARDEFRLGRMNWIHTWLLDACSRAGVRWLPSAELLSCTPGPPIELSLAHCRHRESLTADYVVGADGPRSLVARMFGLDRNREFLVGLEEIVPHDGKPALHCYLDPLLAPGYIAWVIADRGEAHIGVAGYRHRFDPARALTAFRRKVGLAAAPVLERRGGLIPVNGILRRIASERALLTGDAAGAVSPLTAGGIDGALRLSAYAASVIARAAERSEGIRQYDGGQFQARFAARRWMRRALNAVQRYPSLTEAAFTMLRIPPLSSFANHVFFSRGSFPDPAPARSGSQSAVAAAQ